jgi:hypothetical protein
MEILRSNHRGFANPPIRSTTLVISTPSKSKSTLTCDSSHKTVRPASPLKLEHTGNTVAAPKVFGPLFGIPAGRDASGSKWE